MYMYVLCIGYVVPGMRVRDGSKWWANGVPTKPDPRQCRDWWPEPAGCLDELHDERWKTGWVGRYLDGWMEEHHSPRNTSALYLSFFWHLLFPSFLEDRRARWDLPSGAGRRKRLGGGRGRIKRKVMAGTKDCMRKETGKEGKWLMGRCFLFQLQIYTSSTD